MAKEKEGAVSDLSKLMYPELMSVEELIQTLEQVNLNCTEIGCVDCSVGAVFESCRDVYSCREPVVVGALLKFCTALVILTTSAMLKNAHLNMILVGLILWCGVIHQDSKKNVHSQLKTALESRAILWVTSKTLKLSVFISFHA
jgi:hypothetical protein